jgi:tetratricopeptide (TPR) repeat protein
MSKQIGTIIFFTFLAISGQAQQKLSYPEVDKKSYELFLEKNWMELIKLSKESVGQGINFFYLQARTGIAYYNLKKYRTAAKWFLMAWENDKSFEWLQEYLYYSLLWGGRTGEAEKIAENFSRSLRQKNKINDKKITRLALEGGLCFNPEFNSVKEEPHGQQAGVGENYGEAFYLKNYHFETLDLSHNIAPGLNLNHSLTYIGLNREEHVDWGQPGSFPIKINQFQYLINPGFVLAKKIYLSPSATIIWGNSDLYLGGLTNNAGRFFYNSPYNYSDYIFSAPVWSHFGNFSPGGEINIANINNESVLQLSGWLTLYPFSNLNFYITPRIYLKSGEDNRLGYNALGISGGIQLGPVHLYGQYLNGEMKNFIESAGYVVSNFPGVSKQKFSGSLYLPTGKKYQLVFRYITQDITEKYQVYTNLVKSNSINYKYIKHTLTAGISWNF